MNQLNTKKQEIISVDNINKIYFDLKTAQNMAGVSNQTLYSYANNNSDIVEMVKFRGKNYLHIDAINFIKTEVEISKSVRNSTDMTIKNNKEHINTNITNNEIIRLKSDLDKANEKIQILNEQLEKERESKTNLINEMFNIKQELGELREFKKNNSALNETIKSLTDKNNELYNNQINTLIETNNDMMDKFNKLIDTQNAFQAMLAQKEQTSQKLIEKKSGFWNKLLKK